VAVTLPNAFTYAAATPANQPAPSPPTPAATAPNPAFAPVAQSPDGPDHRYFPETHHTLHMGFKTFWDMHGGVTIFGLPISEEFQEKNPSDGKTYTVQYFERNRFEYHPENKGTPYEVELGLLGVQLTQGRSGETPFKPVPAFDTTAKSRFVPATGHGIAGAIRSKWEAPDALALLGYPISEAFEEKNPSDGKTYTVQYFERARLEIHPEFAGKPNEIELGLLGVQAAVQHGYIPAP
jgi:spore germination protein